jgi:hypothetical protein
MFDSYVWLHCNKFSLELLALIGSVRNVDDHGFGCEEVTGCTGVRNSQVIHILSGGWKFSIC